MQYRGFSPSDDIVVWFWRLVHSLKEEEKALLLKFATGSPRAPAGGFSTLQVHQECIIKREGRVSHSVYKL
jgi:hypothetical protein